MCKLYSYSPDWFLLTTKVRSREAWKKIKKLVTNSNVSRTWVASSPLPSCCFLFIAVPSAGCSQSHTCGNICSRLISSGWKVMAETCLPVSRLVMHGGRESQQWTPLAEQVLEPAHLQSSSSFSLLFPFNLDFSQNQEGNNSGSSFLPSQSCTRTDKWNSYWLLH